MRTSFVKCSDRGITILFTKIFLMKLVYNTKKSKHIPINQLPDDFDTGIVVGKTLTKRLDTLGKAEYSHRRDYHIFILADNGTATFEIDFEVYEIKFPYVIYIHPNQVHRVSAFEQADFFLLAVRNESIKPKYLKLLEQFAPINPLALDEQAFSIVRETASLCLNIFERKTDRLYPSLLQDCSNTLIALIVSQFIEQSVTVNSISRSEFITGEFKFLLERDFASFKRPSDYSATLNISTSYLNECVKNSTGHSVSYHIQHRIILEAKRLLHYSNKSIKEIANELGYDDHAYFSRLFNKLAGMTARNFRKKNLD